MYDKLKISIDITCVKLTPALPNYCYIHHMTSDIRPYHFSVCNIEKQGLACEATMYSIWHDLLYEARSKFECNRDSVIQHSWPTSDCWQGWEICRVRSNLTLTYMYMCSDLLILTACALHILYVLFIWTYSLGRL